MVYIDSNRRDSQIRVPLVCDSQLNELNEVVGNCCCVARYT
jgi:hypothetical protein